MGASKTEDVLRLIMTRLQPHLDLERLVLFGSHARGEATSSSDYDVLVVAETSIPFIQRQGLALHWLGRRDFPVDLLVYTPKELETAADLPGSAAYWALQEGKVYFAK